MCSFQQVYNMHQSQPLLLSRKWVCHFVAVVMHSVPNLGSCMDKVAGLHRDQLTSSVQWTHSLQSAAFTASVRLNAIFASSLPQIAVAWHSGNQVWSLSGPVHQRM